MKAPRSLWVKGVKKGLEQIRVRRRKWFPWVHLKTTIQFLLAASLRSESFPSPFPRGTVSSLPITQAF